MPHKKPPGSTGRFFIKLPVRVEPAPNQLSSGMAFILSMAS